MPANTALIDELLLKLEPEWGTKKIENLRLIYQLGDEKRKERIEKILSIAVKKHLNDSLLNNKVMLPPSTKEECFGKGQVFMGTVCYGKDSRGKDRELYPLYLDYEDIKNHIIITGLSGTGNYRKFLLMERNKHNLPILLEIYFYFLP